MPARSSHPIRPARAPHSHRPARSWRAGRGIWRPSTSSAAAAARDAVPTTPACCSSRLVDGALTTMATWLTCDQSAAHGVGASQRSGRGGRRRHEAARLGVGHARQKAAARLVATAQLSAADTAVAEKNRRCSAGVRGAGDGVVDQEDEFRSRQGRTGRTVAKAQVRGSRGEFARPCPRSAELWFRALSRFPKGKRGARFTYGWCQLVRAGTALCAASQQCGA
jgi:hypothetical protein